MASSEILAKIGLNSAGFKTGLAQCKLAANSFKSSIGGMFKNLGSQVLGMLGVSAGIAGLPAVNAGIAYNIYPHKGINNYFSSIDVMPMYSCSCGGTIDLIFTKTD